jgi:hypothetical protein
MKAFTWLKNHWYIPFFAVVAVLGAIGGALLQRKWNSPVRRLKTEMKAIDAGAAAAESALNVGHEKTVSMLEDLHKETIDALEEKQKKKVEKLKQDPAAMSRWLVRIASDG